MSHGRLAITRASDRAGHGPVPRSRRWVRLKLKLRGKQDAGVKFVLFSIELECSGARRPGALRCPAGGAAHSLVMSRSSDVDARIAP